jgi:hypothetical protein
MSRTLKNDQGFQTFTCHLVTDFNITESANGEKRFYCVTIKSHTIRRALATHFPIPLPLSVILNNIKRPHPVEIQNTVVKGLGFLLMGPGLRIEFQG